MQFGHFDDKTKEYIIHRPDTPIPWINYLGSESFFGLISNTAGGYCFYRDPRMRRLTRYRYNNLPFDNGGRYIYLRDNNSSEIWSPTWQPLRKPLDHYECHHGLGYTVISSLFKGIEVTILYFIPLGENLEIWYMHIVNNRTEMSDLSVFSFIEFCLWDAYDDATNFQRNFNTGEVAVDLNLGVIYHITEYRERRNHFAYFACSEPLQGFDTQRESFCGSYRGFDHPLVVEQGKSQNSIAHGWAPIGSHSVKITLAPQQSKDVIFILGYHENAANAKFLTVPEEKENEKSHHLIYSQPVTNYFYLNTQAIEAKIIRYRKVSVINASFLDLKEYWKGLLSKFQVKTPDKHTNRMMNIWNQYQCMITFNISRAASFFESGIGRGIGFRDSNQDLLGFVHLIPNRARERILDLASTQLESGGAYHQYQPLNKKGNNDIGGDFNDDPLWLVLSVIAYLKETGDFSILEEKVSFNSKPGSEQSLFVHLERCFQYTTTRLGPHELPLIGRADWNDCLNLNCFSTEPNQSFQTTTNKNGHIAESLFIAAQFVLAASEFSSLLLHMKQLKKAEYYQDLVNRMRAAILQYGWDGEWFLRAYDDLGNKIGSKSCEEGQIFIESQGMCIMAGVGSMNDYATTALNSVKKYLATPHGLMLLQPPYHHYHVNLGEISSYPPGYKENGSIFCHANPWIMIAEVMVGHGDQAYEYYQCINPSVREKVSEVHRCEPYVYAQMIAGKDAPTFGEAKNSWLTGAAAWNFVAISQWILGIHPTFSGLLINPVIPSTWSEFSVIRIFREVTYNIKVKRGVKGQKIQILVNNTPIDGNVIPIPPPDVKKVSVDVQIG